MRVIILGSGGRLGAALLREWTAQGLNVTGLARPTIDLADGDSLRRALDREFDVVVNCAALTNVDYCETHAEEANQANGHAVGLVGGICSERGARCIHISTDYVFDGATDRPYTEDNEARPISVYGSSKLLGERLLLESGSQHLVARVSWVFGPDRPSFVDQILKKALESDAVEAIGDKWATPSYTLDIGQLLKPFLSQVPANGVLHVCNRGYTTWKEYGQFALDVAAELNAPLKARKVGHLAMAELKAFVARRPPFTAMATDKLVFLTERIPRPWQDAVREHVVSVLPKLTA